MEHTFLTSASPDICAVIHTLTSRYKDCKKPQAPSAQPTASDLPPEDIDLESQKSSPKHDSHTIPHDAMLSEIPQISTQPAIDDHPLQHDIIIAEAPSAQPAASYLPSEEINLESQQPAAPEHDSHTIPRDAIMSEIPQLSAQPAIDDHPPQDETRIIAEDSLLQPTADHDNQSSAHKDHQCQQSAADTGYPPQHDEDQATGEEKPIINEDFQWKHDRHVADSELLPALQSTAVDTHSVMEPLHNEHNVVVEEAETVTDDHSPQQESQGGLMAELLPVFQSIVDTHSVIKEDSQTEAPLVQSTIIDDGLLPPLQDNQPSQEQPQPGDEMKYSLQELVSISNGMLG